MKRSLNRSIIIFCSSKMNWQGLGRSEERSTILFSWGKFNSSRLPIIKINTLQKLNINVLAPIQIEAI